MPDVVYKGPGRAVAKGRNGDLKQSGLHLAMWSRGLIEVQALTSRGVPAVGGLQIPIEDLEAVIQGLRAVSTENNKKG